MILDIIIFSMWYLRILIGLELYFSSRMLATSSPSTTKGKVLWLYTSSRDWAIAVLVCVHTFSTSWFVPVAAFCGGWARSLFSYTFRLLKGSNWYLCMCTQGTVHMCRPKQPSVVCAVWIRLWQAPASAEPSPGPGEAFRASVCVQKYPLSYAVLWIAEFSFESLRSEHSSLKLEFLLYPSADRGLVPLQWDGWFHVSFGVQCPVVW